MTFLPIVERELRVAARSAATYRNRSLAAGGVMLAAMFSLFFGAIAWTPSSAGAAIFKLLAALALFFCVLEGARKTADCLSEEKREGTIGLLFLTDLKGYDIVLGKLAGTSLSSVYGLIAILPVLALPMLLGGVLAGEFWRVVLALLNILFLSLCLGMFVSSISRNEQKAMGVTVGIMVGLGVWMGFSSAAVNPAHAFVGSFQVYYRSGAAAYWESIGAGQLAGWLLLGGACVLLPHAWQERALAQPGAALWRRPLMWWPQQARWERRVRREMLAVNPVAWLVARQTSMRFTLYTIAGIAGLCALGFYLGGSYWMPVYLGVCWGLNIMVKVRMALQAVHCTAEARRNSSLETLLVTPLRTEQIYGGYFGGLQHLFQLPVIILLSVETAGYVVGTIADGDWKSATAGDLLSIAVIVGAGYLVLMVLDSMAVMWAGMWFGLTTRKESQAITKTVLLVLVLPYLCLICSCLGAPIFFLSSGLWIIWARGRLQTQFRQQATGSGNIAPPDRPLLPLPTFKSTQPPLPPIINP